MPTRSPPMPHSFNNSRTYARRFLALKLPATKWQLPSRHPKKKTPSTPFSKALRTVSASIRPVQGTFITFIFAGYSSLMEPAMSAAAYPQYSQQKAIIFGSKTPIFSLFWACKSLLFLPIWKCPLPNELSYSAEDSRGRNHYRNRRWNLGMNPGVHGDN